MRKLIAGLLFLPGSLFSQLPARLELVKVCDTCKPTGFAFFDSSNGAITSDDDVFTTTDGGASWQVKHPTSDLQNLSFFSFVPGFSSPLMMITSSVFLYRSTAILITRDTGSTWTLSDAIVFPGGSTVGVFIFDAATSFTFLARRNSQQKFTGQQYIKSSRDTFRTFEEVYGDTTFEGYQIRDVFFRDSSHVFAEYKSGFKRSSDGGRMWTAFDPYAGLAYQRRGDHRLQGGTDANQLFLIPDMAITTDDGASWHIDSTFARRVYRLATPEPNKWWALIGQLPLTSYPYKVTDDTGMYIDTLAYTSDGGKTWLKQAMQEHETMTDIVFPDPRHGYIVVYRHPSTYIYRWAPVQEAESQKGVRQAEFISTETGLKVIPPNEQSLWQLAIYDVLGRKISSRAWDHGEVYINLHWLLSGYYIAVLEGRGYRASFHFVK